MKVIQVHCLEYEPGSRALANNKVFLNVSSEGHRPRRFEMGSFTQATVRGYESIVYLTHSPVTFTLSNGPFRYHFLGVHTVYDFGEGTFNQRQTATFGNRGTSIFRLTFSIRTTHTMYQYSVESLTCLRQVTFAWGVLQSRDRFYAKVEFNHSPHEIDPAGVNVYSLGKFSSYQGAGIHSSHNFADYVLCTYQFIPYTEAMENSRNLTSYSSPSGQKTRPTPFQLGKSESLIMRRFDPNLSEFIILEVEPSEVIDAVLKRGKLGYDLTFALSRCAHFCSNLKPDDLSSRIHHSAAVRLFLALSLPYHPERVSVLSPRKLYSGDVKLSSEIFNTPTNGNTVQVLIDGDQTYKAMYEGMMRARHSIRLLAWEVSFTVGLVKTQFASEPRPILYDHSSQWITFMDVILSKAKQGVAISIALWQHEYLGVIDRYLHQANKSAGDEIEILKAKAAQVGVNVKVFSSKDKSITQVPFAKIEHHGDADIVIVIAGNPSGLTSAHHEKLLLIDSECRKHSLCFIGGFDIAVGRRDDSSHIPAPPPLPPFINSIFKSSPPSSPTFTTPIYQGKEVLIPWHDTHLMILGPSVELLRLHFAQRWSHAFTGNPHTTRNLEIANSMPDCSLPNNPQLPGVRNCVISLERTWKGVFEVYAEVFDRELALTNRNFLFDDYKRLIQSAKRFIYIEHQYPFQIFALTYYICEALKTNPNLYVIIVTSVKNDLPTGFIGELFDWSQDQIMENLHLIRNTAPERVGIYGLVVPHPGRDGVIPVYVHSKVMICDDEILTCGSANMDNISFFYSSELSITISNSTVAKGMRVALCSEHLGPMIDPESFTKCFKRFNEVATQNLASLKSGQVSGRIVFLSPVEHYNKLLKSVRIPTSYSKILHKLGMHPSTLKRLLSVSLQSVKEILLHQLVSASL